MPAKILVVDDEPKIVEVVERYLIDEDFRVATAYDGPAAIAAFESERPDLVILDLKLPGMSGLDVFRSMRARTDVPVIMLTSRVEEADRVVGLELGADDYITKPFSPREVVARVKTVLRRVTHVTESPDKHSDPPVLVDGAVRSQIRIGELEIDTGAHEVRWAGKTVQLTPTEFRLLMVLAQNAGRAFTRAQLLELIKGDDLEIFDRTLDRHIANLRHKVEADPSKPRYILTVFGVGYKMAKQP